MSIQIVTSEQANVAFIAWENGEDLEVFPMLALLPNTNGTYTAIDNSTNDFYCEDFPSMSLAVAWLNGEFEISDMLMVANK